MVVKEANVVDGKLVDGKDARHAISIRIILPLSKGSVHQDQLSVVAIY